MKMSEKKLAAAMAAVTAYISTEEQALFMAVTGLPKKPRRDTRLMPWGQSGRRDIMQLRNMMQLRTFK